MTTTTGSQPKRFSLPSRTVGDVMHTGIVACAPQTDLATVARHMADERIHCVVVEGLTRTRHGGEQLVWGLLSDLDLVRAAMSQLDIAAGDVASTEVVAIGTDEPLDEAARLMVEHDLGHLIVVASGGEPVGVISTLDLARAIATW
jgi:CBS domain-containing protein